MADMQSHHINLVSKSIRKLRHQWDQMFQGWNPPILSLNRESFWKPSTSKHKRKASLALSLGRHPFLGQLTGDAGAHLPSIHMHLEDPKFSELQAAEMTEEVWLTRTPNARSLTWGSHKYHLEQWSSTFWACHPFIQFLMLYWPPTGELFYYYFVTMILLYKADTPPKGVKTPELRITDQEGGLTYRFLDLNPKSSNSEHLTGCISDNHHGPLIPFISAGSGTKSSLHSVWRTRG